jgi:hypothetical protein
MRGLFLLDSFKASAHAKKTFAQPRKGGLTVEEAQLCLEVGVWADIHTSLRSASAQLHQEQNLCLEGKKKNFGGQK